VLSTLHTNDAPTAVTRLIDLGVPGYLINSTLLGVMAQRLVRTLCPHCKKAVEAPDDDAWKAITAPYRADKPAEVMGAVGCLECRMTGYYGRIGLYEVMAMTSGLRRLVHQGAEDGAIREQAMKDGMKPLRVSGAMKVASGHTTAEEVMKVAPLA
jgi:general secretion pathway protein E